MGIELLRSLCDRQVGIGVLVLDHPDAIRGQHKLLLDTHLIDKVEVDVRWRVKPQLFNRILSIQRDVESSGEAIALAVDRHEAQIDTTVACDHKRIHDIILIVACGQSGGERTDKSVQHDVDVVVEDIHPLEDLLEVGGQ